MSGTAEKQKKHVKYRIEGVVAKGSFGTVYQATVIGTTKIVAIKKVLQDRRYKQRELELMQTLSHPNVVKLLNSFLSVEGKKSFLNIVMEFLPSTIYRIIRSHARASKCIPYELSKCYAYQMIRSLAYIHSLGI